MTLNNLNDYLNLLDKRGLLTSIEAEVDPVLEITEITDRVSKAHGNALRFNKVKGSNYPLVINTMGSFERLALGLSVDSLEEIADEIEDYMNLSAYVSLKDKIKAIPKLAPLPFIFPKKVTKAPCQEVIEEPDLSTLPILQCWPQDGGRYITLPLVFTKDPETGQQNCGMYRLQVYDKKTTGMHWHLHKDGKEIYEKYRQAGTRMPVAVALGCDPATIYAATAPLPKMIDEMIFAGYLRKKAVELVKCITSDLYVPAQAEFILEGYVDLEERRREGPFGDHTGYYSLADDYPVFHIEKITRRRNPIYPTTIVGKPPMEDCYLGKATERIFLPLMKIQCPEIVDMNLPLEGVFHNCAIVSIDKKFPRHANKVLYALWGLGQMMYTKMILIVDKTVDVHDPAAVMQAVLDNVQEENQMILTEGPLDALDHASDRPFQGYRLGVDATMQLPAESALNKYESTDVQTELNKLRNGEPCRISILRLDKKSGLKHKDLFATHPSNETKTCYLILVDTWIDPKDLSTVAWKVFNNIDPKRDIQKARTAEGELLVIIDATKKGPEDGLMRPWPDDIVMSEEIIQRVNERWVEYGFEL